MPVERRRRERRRREQADEGLATVLLAKLGQEINIIIANGDKPLLGDKEHNALAGVLGGIFSPIYVCRCSGKFFA